MNEQAFTLKPGRNYRYFKNMKPTLLHEFNSQKLYRWINEHKKTCCYTELLVENKYDVNFDSGT